MDTEIKKPFNAQQLILMGEIVRNTEFHKYVKYHMPITGQYIIDYMRECIVDSNYSYGEKMAEGLNQIRGYWIRYNKVLNRDKNG